MPASGRTVFIAGAGIGGLTLALALAKFGGPVVILERLERVAEFGAGVQISPNARRVLNRLGLDRQVAAQSFEPEGIDVYAHGAEKPVVTLALGNTVRERYGAPYAVMHRGDLVDLLHRACRRFANIDIVFNVPGFEVTSRPEGVTVTASGTTLAAATRAFAFIGADGIHSATRMTGLGGPPARDTGTVAWRTMLEMDALDGRLALDRQSLLLGPGCHAVCYPLPHRRAVNVALFTPRAAAATGGDRPDLPAGAATSPLLASILEAAGDGWTRWPLATVEAPAWHSGNIGLIGDAAHAMLPFQAQGAAMAMEDAATLAPLLMAATRAEPALRRFEALRRPRVARVARVSARNATIFHMKPPLARARDLVMRLQGRTGHLRRLGWLYGFDAAPEEPSGASTP